MSTQYEKLIRRHLAAIFEEPLAGLADLAEDTSRSLLRMAPGER